MQPTGARGRHPFVRSPERSVMAALALPGAEHGVPGAAPQDSGIMESMTDSERLDRLERQVEELRVLVAGRTGAVPDVSDPAPEDPEAQDGAEGTLTFRGSILRGERRFRFQVRTRLSDALEADPESVARVFAAFASAFRVRLLRVLLDGPRSSSQLQEELGVGAVGQLYHHLKELLVAGLVVQRKRNLYELREEFALPVCLAFVVAPRLTPPSPTAPVTMTGIGQVPPQVRRPGTQLNRR